MVKEGHDSTVRPKTRIWEFDQGRKFLDEWAADGKPGVSRIQMQRVQMLKVYAACLLPPFLLLLDYSAGETMMSPIKRSFYSWWCKFSAIDVADAAKARAVMPRREQ
tara:strand:+ start:1344 stop:1664 length:321 start_codon:yes stop_codon:yes gene_type:complete